MSHLCIHYLITFVYFCIFALLCFRETAKQCAQCAVYALVFPTMEILFLIVLFIVYVVNSLLALMYTFI